MARISSIGVDTRTIATITYDTVSVYVDAAATGTGDGSSWTNAFTTLSDAITAVTPVIANNITIYVRKGASPYAGTSINRTVIKNAVLNIRGEYYWYGTCAEAATASTTKFNITATDGANIAAGDRVRVMRTTFSSDAYKNFTETTVIAAVDKGSNIWEVEITDAADWGNISTDAVYTIVKTEIGAITITGSSVQARLSGLYINTSVASTCALTISNGAIADIYYCIMRSTTLYGLNLISQSSVNGCYGSHFVGTTMAIYTFTNSTLTLGAATPTYYGSSVDTTTSSGVGITIDRSSSAGIYNTVINASGTSGQGIRVRYGSNLRYYNIKISSSTTTGLYANDAGFIVVTGATSVIDATTPRNPAAASDPSYVE